MNRNDIIVALYYLLIILLYITVAGCVSSKPVADKPKPVVKNWIYKVTPITSDNDSLKAVIVK